jgi:hypothetical protein
VNHTYSLWRERGREREREENLGHLTPAVTHTTAVYVDGAAAHVGCNDLPYERATCKDSQHSLTGPEGVLSDCWYISGYAHQWRASAY